MKNLVRTSFVSTFVVAYLRPINKIWISISIFVDNIVFLCFLKQLFTSGIEHCKNIFWNLKPWVNVILKIISQISWNNIFDTDNKTYQPIPKCRFSEQPMVRQNLPVKHQFINYFIGEQRMQDVTTEKYSGDLCNCRYIPRDLCNCR